MSATCVDGADGTAGRADEPVVLVYDVGGTSVRAGVYRPGVEIVAGATRETPSSWAHAGESARQIREQLFSEMREMGDLLLRGESPAVVSVAFPGPIDSCGRALRAPTVWSDTDGDAFPVRLAVQETWPDSQAVVLNDVTAAGLYYRRHQQEDFCVVTVSSGVGHKVFVGGQPAVGPHGRGGELGHLRVDFTESAPRCECGGVGHLGAIASGRGTLMEAIRRADADAAGFEESQLHAAAGGNPRAIDNEMLAAAFCDADAWTARVVERGAHFLGCELAALHTGMGIERFVIVGGFALALGEEYRRMLADRARHCCWDLGQSWDEMIELGDEEAEAGLIGAGRYAVAGRHLD